LPWPRTAARKPLRDAQRRVTECAALAGKAHFLWEEGDQLVYSDAPPRDGIISSVNERGEWSMHLDTATIPLETAPDVLASLDRPSPARLAAQDLGAGTALPGRPAEPDVPRAAMSAQHRPARRR
jgi:hypothetical protein